MPEFELKAKPPLGDYVRSFGGLRLTERSDLALVSLAIPLGGDEKIARAAQKAWGLDLPDNGKSVINGDGIRLIRSARDQYLVQFVSQNPQAEAQVDEALGGVGYTTDQTHAWVTLEIAGDDVRTPLERICPIDLHKDIFLVDDGARTSMEHMGAFILRSDENAFLLMSASSSAQSFLDAIETSILNTTP